MAIAADGYLADQEGVKTWSLMLSRMKLFSDHRGEALNRMLDKLLDRLKQEGPGQLGGYSQGLLTARNYGKLCLP